MRYAVILDYGVGGLYRDYPLETFDGMEQAVDFAEAFAIGCETTMPDGSRVLDIQPYGDGWQIIRAQRPPAMIAIKEVP